VQHGFSLVLSVAGLMYALAALSFPNPRSAS
jgi:hypothetical protein